MKNSVTLNDRRIMRIILLGRGKGGRLADFELRAAERDDILSIPRILSLVKMKVSIC
jgi:hypothetical protein